MTITLDEILDDKPKVKIMFAVAVIVFFLGLALSYMPIYKADSLVAECNQHWVEQTEMCDIDKQNAAMGLGINFTLVTTK